MITGTQNPVIGQEEFYQYTDSFDPFNSSNATYVWNIWKKLKSGSWVDVTTKSPKVGLKVSFKFFEKVTGEEFKLQVYKITKKLLSDQSEQKLMSELYVIPESSKIGRIDKVILFNRGAKDVNKAHYIDTLVAKAFCTGLFNREIEFQLWEDDAVDKGHNPTINKNNSIPIIYKAKVNENGIAEVKIPLSANQKIMKQIANKYLSAGETDEGANHEFYVTASYLGKIQGASQTNVNVANPDYKPPKDKPKPKDDSHILSGTSNKPTSTGKYPDIISADFVNTKGQKLSKISVGNVAVVKILSHNMIGKVIKLIIWEEDVAKPDKVYEKNLRITADENYHGIFIDKTMFEKGIDTQIEIFGNHDPDKDKQTYYIEIIPQNLDAKSKTFGLTDEYMGKLEVGKSPAMVKEVKVKKKNNNEKGSCSCNNDLNKEQLKEIAINATQVNIDKYFDGFNETFTKFNINSCLQKLHFLAQVIHESGSFRYNVEQGNAAYLAKYGGWHGRGLIQLTTKPNYEAFEKAIGDDVTSSEEARDKVTKSPYAVYSAGWFWDKRAVLNGYADKNDFIYITYRVNGGYNHIDDRLAIVKRGFTTLYSKCVNDKGKNTDYKFSESKAYNDKKASFAWGLWHDPQFSKDGCKKDKDLAIEGYQRYVDLTTETDLTANYYSVQGLSYFSDLVYTKIVKGKTKKYVSVRKAALKRLNELKK